MRLGYSASKRRNYSDALFYFNRALQKRPSDRYARVAIRNITFYIARNRQAGRGRSPIAFLPTNLGSPHRRVAGGTRGGDSNQSLPILTLLVPHKQDGLTLSGHPTFFWHVSKPAPMIFILTEPGVPQPLVEQQIQPQAGIIQLKMPEDLPELVPGREYRWSVTLVDNPDRPSANPFVQSRIKRVPMTPDLELTQELAAAAAESDSSPETLPNSPAETLRDRAMIYAQAGLWYDALEAISAAYAANPNDQSILEDRLKLLDQVGLDYVTTQERQRSVRQ